MRNHFNLPAILVVALLASTASVVAQTGEFASPVPGSVVHQGYELQEPSATTTISGKQLPPPDPKFGGVIKDDALQSKPWWAPRVVPPKGAPNVLLIITDDAGFGVPSTFGGVIPTPTMDRIAQRGPALQQHVTPPRCARRRAPR